ncbi:DUF5819 family protein [Streptomyces sp. NPDC047000]|uniref:DUF5819 family protein n=1 Tax=Streptomyces sp. NPDC047000 TaxID=3155474 RepID=UPI0033EA73EF
MESTDATGAYGSDPSAPRVSADGPAAARTGPAASPVEPPTGPVVPPADPTTGHAVPPPDPPTGYAALAGLSAPYRAAAAVAVALVGVVAVVHLGMVFLHVAPSNTVSRQHSRAIDDWIYPEFEQNWKLFAPNPLQQDIAVQVRADTRGADGTVRTTGWYDLSAEDGRAVDGSLLPSHTRQNELRRAWDFFLASHDGEGRPVGLRGALSEQYLRRIAVLRLDRDGAVGRGGGIDRVQVRSVTTNVPPPRWSGEQVSTMPAYHELPWWTVPADEAEGGVK